jgi:AraC-like DNA-binding protein
MINQAWLTGIQALQLIGIGPSLLLLSFLALALKEPLKSIAPFLFLLSLSAGFFTVLVPLLEWPATGWQHTALQVVMEAFPACAFLLMMQFLRGALPTGIFWLILLPPLMGSGALIYLSQITEGDICVTVGKNLTCVSNVDLHSIYMVVIGGVIMLLMMMEIIRSRFFFNKQPGQRDQYWLIIALVVLTVALLSAELLRLMQAVKAMDAIWMSTMTRLAFVFLMFTSFFRVFGGQFTVDVEKVPTAERILTGNERSVAARLESLLQEEKLYREMGLNRLQLAERLGVSESRLSHIVNRYFGHNLNLLLNQRRVEEARERLVAEPKTQITVIAFEVGFNSIATFNRVFKEIVGVSPSEWRSRH